MFVLIGKVVNVIKERTKTTNKEFTTVQVMSNGGGKVRIQNVTDWDNRKWEIDKEVKLPVMVSAWANGKNISVVAING